MNMQERDELLIRLDERTISIDKGFKEHLRRHWAITAVVSGASISAIVGLIIAAV